nr:MAG TPA: zinc finger domain protein [Bacteriophage sp.]
MKKLENQTVFQCSYCSRISKSAAGIYQHERFCKKNPHNQLLCASCIHCQRVETLSEEGEKCEICPHRDDIYGDCTGCDSRIRYTDFICAIDGSKMYAPNKIRRKTAFEEIKKRCDKPMVDSTQECKNYKYQGL